MLCTDFYTEPSARCPGAGQTGLVCSPDPPPPNNAAVGSRRSRAEIRGAGATCAPRPRPPPGPRGPALQLARCCPYGSASGICPHGPDLHPRTQAQLGVSPLGLPRSHSRRELHPHLGARSSAGRQVTALRLALPFLNTNRCPTPFPAPRGLYVLHQFS